LKDTSNYECNAQQHLEKISVYVNLTLKLDVFILYSTYVRNEILL